MNTLEQAAAAIINADGLLITAGAGLGVDSRLPDFRGTDGFWKAYPALAKSGIQFHEIANPNAFARSPRQAWGFYGHRLNLYRETLPHAGFQIMRRFAAKAKHGSYVYTSNVDGQFQKAGFNPQRISEVHGSIHHLQCVNGCLADIWLADDFLPVVDEDQCELISEFPRCPHCGDIARPNILMFGDWNWLQFRSNLQSVGLHDWRQSVARLVVIEIGAGKDIPTVRNFSERVGGKLIRINPRDNQVPDGGISIRSGSLEALEAIDQLLSQ
jgi:NAD-dependent SIR2 family protein deacetylase